MNIYVRVFGIVALLLTFAASAGSASAEATRECSSEFPPAEGCTYSQDVEVLTFTGPAGEQVAVFCIDGQAVFGARFDAAGEIRFPGVPGSPSCNATGTVLPGHELIMYTAPDEGWTINPWTDMAEICVEGELATVWTDDSRPGISYSDSEVCAMAWNNTP